MYSDSTMERRERINTLESTFESSNTLQRRQDTMLNLRTVFQHKIVLHDDLQMENPIGEGKLRNTTIIVVSVLCWYDILP